MAATITKAGVRFRYSYKENYRGSVSPQVAGEELARIAAETSAEIDNLTPEVVVEEARPETSPLHPSFEWDDSVAAEEHRKAQARRLIHSVRVVEIKRGKPLGAPRLCYVSVHVPEVGRAYVSAARVMSDDNLRQQALDDARKVLAGFRQRFAHLRELAEVFGAIDRLNEAG